MSEPDLILFDGVCNLCNASINFIIRRDKHRRFRFVPLQSSTGQQVMKKLGLPLEPPESMILVENGMYYLRSTAALRIARSLGALWPLLYLFIIIPPALRDALYNYIARNRYLWFGKRDACMVPTPDVVDRFIT